MQDNILELGRRISIRDCMDVIKGRKIITFSDDYKKRVQRAEEVLQQWIDEGNVIYGVTTGFGSLSTRNISHQEMEQLQENILLSHAVSVGDLLSRESVRAIMLSVLQNLGYGVSGVRLELLERYRMILNSEFTPWAPGSGSVGYLAVEAHIALPLIGKGKLIGPQGIVSTAEGLQQIGLEKMKLRAKEGLALISGTTSPTGLSVLATWYAKQALDVANCIAAMELEVSGGNISAYGPELSQVRPRTSQREVAQIIRNILKDSSLIGTAGRVQDALSLRCAAQLHGTVKEAVSQAGRIVEEEINACCDNPIVWTEPGKEEVISGGNPDSSYIGWSMDSLAIGVTMLAKMSERRTNRLLDENLSGKPAFLISNPGVNSGLMITQYTQAGLLNEMRVLAYPATVDNTPTCANQEDYVAMGYVAAHKALTLVEKLEYILAIELLAVYQAYYFVDRQKMSKTTKLVFERMREVVPALEKDEYIHPYIEIIKNMIHEGVIIDILKKEDYNREIIM